MPENPIIATRNIAFSYGRQPVLDSLDLSFQAGRFYGIIGPNGCGKTTLLDLLIGSRTPARGSIRLEDRPLEAFSRRDLAVRLALAPQEFHINFPFSVTEVVFMGRHPHMPRFASPSIKDWEIVKRAMEIAGVSTFKDQPVTNLSGGEKQRVVLARALAQDTAVLMLDEPTSNLDVRHALDLLGAVKNLVDRLHRTSLAVMHDLNLAAAFCDELIFIKNGRVHAAGPTRQVLSEANVREVFNVEAKVYLDDYAGSPRVVFNTRDGA